jgi:serine/threonine protein phosphatase PrpC
MVAILNGKKLSIANLGDSGFMIIRFKNREAFTFSKSKEQQHNFNIPFQLSYLPREKDFELLEE